MEISHQITSLDQLESLYRKPSGGAVDKELDHIDDGMAAFIDRCTFVVLATSNASGQIDASPRGGPPGFIRRLDERHIAIPDLNGNNRLDSYRNIVTFGHAGLLMIVPGKEETVRLNGPAVLSNDPELLAGFTRELRTPKMALVIETAEIFGHCAKAFRRGMMWESAAWSALSGAPDLADMYAERWNMTEEEVRDSLSTAYREQLAQD